MGPNDRPRDPTGHAYKEVTLRQLQGFCETVRLGSLKAAAELLGLSHPTVWKQVHSLERQFGVKLIEPHARGCRPTEAGRLLSGLASPLVVGIGALQETFRQALPRAEAHIVIAAAPRILIEDLPECLPAFERRWPLARLTLKEVPNEEVDRLVESGDADLGLTATTDHENRRLIVEPCYELDVILVVPEGHPLARRRHLRPEDLRGYPLVNAPDALGMPAVTAVLEDLGLFQVESRRVETHLAPVIRRYVLMGYGIGIVGGLPGRPVHDGLHQRSLSRYFGRTVISLVRKRGVAPSRPVQDFIETMKSVLGPPRPRSDPRPDGPRRARGGEDRGKVS